MRVPETEVQWVGTVEMESPLTMESQNVAGINELDLSGHPTWFGWQAETASLSFTVGNGFDRAYSGRLALTCPPCTIGWLQKDAQSGEASASRLVLLVRWSAYQVYGNPYTWFFHDRFAKNHPSQKQQRQGASSL
ncbi:hypothetical protein MPNT_40156 [Candidatus Methylacidithermus pantelleriae]|uniref:Uncharacterized protein n=1 Tax=Candidatus Methylacidithermus pantelleriae TaxID=2744239 RepID=A0A8J2BV37_9BACT|nr:hypothetical protein MPNT_40156 [Candidatus Methylacidithermus pantelleriae]